MVVIGIKLSPRVVQHVYNRRAIPSTGAQIERITADSSRRASSRQCHRRIVFSKKSRLVTGFHPRGGGRPARRQLRAREPSDSHARESSRQVLADICKNLTGKKSITSKNEKKERSKNERKERSKKKEAAEAESSGGSGEERVPRTDLKTENRESARAHAHTDDAFTDSRSK